MEKLATVLRRKSKLEPRTPVAQVIQKGAVDLRTLERKPNAETISTIREVEAQLAEEPGFVGLALHGSVTKGYSVNFSDVDIMVLIDTSNSPQLVWDFIKKAEELRSRLIQHGKNVDFSVKDVSDAGLFVHPYTGLPHTSNLANIFRPVTGHKIQEYRKRWTEKINALNSEERETVVQLMAKYLADDDVINYKKLKSRIPGLPEKEKLRASRKLAWEKRITRFLGKVPKKPQVVSQELAEAAFETSS